MDVATSRSETSAAKRRRPGVRKHKTTHALTRDQLDGRSAGAKRYDRLLREVLCDLGGAEALDAIQRSLVESFVAITIATHDLTARQARGEQIIVGELAQMSSTMLRLASRLGLDRRSRPPKPVTDTLDDVLAEMAAAKDAKRTEAEDA